MVKDLTLVALFRKSPKNCLLPKKPCRNAINIRVKKAVVFYRVVFTGDEVGVGVVRALPTQ